ncbi:hypothetical protein PIROE2DRAFT_10856, partial [Piromyces sp. E2]
IVSENNVVIYIDYNGREKTGGFHWIWYLSTDNINNKKCDNTAFYKAAKSSYIDYDQMEELFGDYYEGYVIKREGSDNGHMDGILVNQKYLIEIYQNGCSEQNKDQVICTISSNKKLSYSEFQKEFIDNCLSILIDQKEDPEWSIDASGLSAKFSQYSLNFENNNRGALPKSETETVSYKEFKAASSSGIARFNVNTQCGEGSFIGDKCRCNACPVNCASCLNGNTCTKCKEGSSLVDGKCVCSTGFIANEEDACIVEPVKTTQPFVPTSTLEETASELLDDDTTIDAVTVTNNGEIPSEAPLDSEDEEQEENVTPVGDNEDENGSDDEEQNIEITPVGDNEDENGSGDEEQNENIPVADDNGNGSGDEEEDSVNIPPTEEDNENENIPVADDNGNSSGDDQDQEPEEEQNDDIPPIGDNENENGSGDEEEDNVNIPPTEEDNENENIPVADDNGNGSGDDQDQEPEEEQNDDIPPVVDDNNENGSGDEEQNENIPPVEDNNEDENIPVVDDNGNGSGDDQDQEPEEEQNDDIPPVGDNDNENGSGDDQDQEPEEEQNDDIPPVGDNDNENGSGDEEINDDIINEVDDNEESNPTIIEHVTTIKKVKNPMASSTNKTKKTIRKCRIRSKQH